MRWVLAVAFVVVACSRDEVARADPPPQDYGAIRADLESRRVALAREWKRHPARALSKARTLLVTTLRDRLLPAWNGTAWAMNGTSQTPHEGAIACGYFISTTLLHAGFHVERARLGQQASEHITRSLVTSEPIWRSSEQPIEDFVAKLRKRGDGIYLVGLDNHVGFVIVDGGATWFHHSGPGDGVRREPATTASFLSTSHYREAAKLFDDELLEKWLRGDAIATVLPKRP